MQTDGQGPRDLGRPALITKAYCGYWFSPTSVSLFACHKRDSQRDKGCIVLRTQKAGGR